MKYITIIFYLSTAMVEAQSVSVNMIELRIANDSLKTSAAKPELILSLSCKNQSDENLLLYGFAGSHVLTVGVDLLCANQDRISGGIGILVSNEKHERVYAAHKIPDSIDYTAMPLERLKLTLEKNRLEYLSETKISKANSTLSFEKRIDLREFYLKKGVYYLQIVGFSGRSLKTRLVGEEQIEKDMRIHDAKLYQGCAISNEISFKVY